MNDYSIKIGELIQELRKKHGLSQEELAEKTGVSRQAVSKWESQQSMPDIDKIIMLSDFFGVSTDYLLKGINTKQNQNKIKINPVFFAVLSFALCILGFITAFTIYNTRFNELSLLFGIIPIICAFLIFIFTSLHADKTSAQYKKAKKIFYMFGIWFVLLIPFVLISFGVIFIFSNFEILSFIPIYTRFFLEVLPALIYILLCIIFNIIIFRR